MDTLYSEQNALVRVQIFIKEIQLHLMVKYTYSHCPFTSTRSTIDGPRTWTYFSANLSSLSMKISSSTQESWIFLFPLVATVTLTGTKSLGSAGTEKGSNVYTKDVQLIYYRNRVIIMCSPAVSASDVICP